MLHSAIQTSLGTLSVAGCAIMYSGAIALWALPHIHKATTHRSSWLVAAVAVTAIVLVLSAALAFQLLAPAVPDG